VSKPRIARFSADDFRRERCMCFEKLREGWFIAVKRSDWWLYLRIPADYWSTDDQFEYYVESCEWFVKAVVLRWLCYLGHFINSDWLMYWLSLFFSRYAIYHQWFHNFVDLTCGKDRSIVLDLLCPPLS